MSARTRTWVSLWTVYLIWGSTYFAIAKVIATMPPLLSMGIRFTLAGLILIVFVFLTKGRTEFIIPRAEYLSASVLGFVTLGLPLWIALFRTLSREKIAKLTWLGTLVGFAGVVLLLKPGSIESVSGVDSGTLFFYMFMVLIGNVGWALGTYLAPRFPIPKNSLLFTGVEMLAGGVALTIAAFIKGEQLADFLDASRNSWLWFFYLVFIGSIAGYTAYLWLVMNAPVSLTATYAYVNPVIAVLLGVLFLNEKITVNYALGGAIILLGVLTVVSSESNSKRLAKG
ncbi:MAG: EamA family transporter [Actinobacteria bacterium]|nr:EamA family transporter [Actinomycetota bacterium]